MHHHNVVTELSYSCLSVIAVLALAGCTSGAGPSSAPGRIAPANSVSPAAAGPASSTPARAVSPVATAPAASLATAPGADAASELALPGEWAFQGEKLTVAGHGCRPHSTVTVVGAASHASGRVIGSADATASGRFLITVMAPDLEPTVNVSATCDNTAGNTITPAEYALSFVPISILSMPAPVAVTQGSNLTVAGNGCQPDSAVLVESLQLASAGSAVIAQATSSGAGSFSAAIRVPVLAQGRDVIFAACENPWPAETLYPAYIPVNYSAAS
jgi:hypothetical protein